MTRYAPQWLQSGSYSASQDRRLISALWPAAASSGSQVQASSGMQVGILAGQVAVPSQNNTGSSLCTSDAVEYVTLTAAPASGVNRIDLVTCHPRGADLDGGANNDFIFDFVTGTAAATPTVPATPAGQVALAQIYVPGGSAAVTAGNITDVRPGGLNMPPPSGSGSAPRGYVASTVGPVSTVTCGTSFTTIVAFSPTVTAGRRYRVTANLIINNGSTAGVPRVDLQGGDSIARPIMTGGLAMAASAVMTGGSTVLLTPGSTGPVTLTLTGLTTAGTFTVTAGSAQIWLEDIGSQ